MENTNRPSNAEKLFISGFDRKCVDVSKTMSQKQWVKTMSQNNESKTMSQGLFLNSAGFYVGFL